MQNFRDSLGREWPLTVDYGAMRRMRDAGVDFFRIFEDTDPATSIGRRLFMDLGALIETLTAALLPTIEVRKLTADDFRASLSGDCLDTAYDVLFAAVADFFPGARRKIILEAMAVARAEREKLSALPQKSRHTASDAPASVTSIPAT